MSDRRRGRGIAATTVRISASITIAGVVAWLARWRVPSEISVHTDIVGYPIHSEFNVYGYLWTYYCLVLWPALALGIDVALVRLFQRRPPFNRGQAPIDLAAAEPEASDRADAIGLAAHGALCASVLAAGLAWLALPNLFVELTGAGAVVGAALGLLAATRAHPAARMRYFRALSLLAAVTPVALCGAILSTRVLEGPAATIRHVHWLAPLAPVFVAAIATGWLIRRLRNADERELRRLERTTFLMVAVPVALFLFLARLPGPLGPLDPFHDGEGLAAADLIRRGFAPWRELFFIHGLMQDVVRPGIGMHVIENSAWGSAAGVSLLVAPLYWVSQYFLNRHLVGRSWVILATSIVLIVNVTISPGDMRFVLQPLVVLAMARLLARPSTARAAVFSGLGVLHFIVTPEGGFMLLACAAVIVAFEWYYRPSGASVRAALVRTRRCAMFAGTALGAWTAYLAATGALGSYVIYFRTFAPSHELTGGIPVKSTVPLFWFAAIAPCVAAILTLGWLAAGIRTGRQLAREDWAVGAIAIFTLLYCPKFLSRADEHVYQLLGQALPMLYFAWFRAGGLVSAGIARRRPQWTLWNRRNLATALSLLTFLLLLQPHVGDRLRNQLRALPVAFRATAPDDIASPRLGYTVPGAGDTDLLSDLDTAVRELNRDHGRVFDMTNGPAFFYYLFEQVPLTRYYHISMAIRNDTQSDVVRFLRRERPPLAIMDGSVGLPSWDAIPNSVRHYAVSAYVLKHYHAVLSTHEYIFLVRNDATEPDVDAVAAKLTQSRTTDLLASAHTCAWGFAPESFTDPGFRPTERVRLEISSRADGSVVVAFPPGMAPARFGHLELGTKGPMQPADFTILTNGTSSPITFSSDDRPDRYRIRLDNCPEWLALKQTFTIVSSSRQPIEAVWALR